MVRLALFVSVVLGLCCLSQAIIGYPEEGFRPDGVGPSQRQAREDDSIALGRDGFRPGRSVKTRRGVKQVRMTCDEGCAMAHDDCLNTRDATTCSDYKKTCIEECNNPKRSVRQIPSVKTRRGVEKPSVKKVRMTCDEGCAMAHDDCLKTRDAATCSDYKKTCIEACGNKDKRSVRQIPSAKTRRGAEKPSVKKVRMTCGEGCAMAHDDCLKTRDAATCSSYKETCIAECNKSKRSVRQIPSAKKRREDDSIALGRDGFRPGRSVKTRRGVEKPSVKKVRMTCDEGCAMAHDDCLKTRDAATCSDYKKKCIEECNNKTK